MSSFIKILVIPFLYGKKKVNLITDKITARQIRVFTDILSKDGAETASPGIKRDLRYSCLLLSANIPAMPLLRAYTDITSATCSRFFIIYFFAAKINVVCVKRRFFVVKRKNLSKKFKKALDKPQMSNVNTLYMIYKHAIYKNVLIFWPVYVIINMVYCCVPADARHELG